MRSPEDRELEIEKLTTATLGIKDKLKAKMQEDGPNSIPVMLIVVLESSRSISADTEEGVYMGLAIDPERKKAAIAEILEKFPALDAYAVVMHANVWVVDREKSKGFDPDDPEDFAEIKKSAEKRDSLTVTIITPDSVRVVSNEYYEEVEGELVWKRDETLEGGAVEASAHADYRPIRPLREEDFE